MTLQLVDVLVFVKPTGQCFDSCIAVVSNLQDGIKLFTYSFYKQRRAEVQVIVCATIDW
jgi:hypothetical protein